MTVDRFQVFARRPGAPLEELLAAGAWSDCHEFYQGFAETEPRSSVRLVRARDRKVIVERRA